MDKIFKYGDYTVKIGFRYDQNDYLVTMYTYSEKYHTEVHEVLDNDYSIEWLERNLHHFKKRLDKQIVLEHLIDEVGYKICEIHNVVHGFDDFLNVLEDDKISELVREILKSKEKKNLREIQEPPVRGSIDLETARRAARACNCDEENITGLDPLYKCLFCDKPDYRFNPVIITGEPPKHPVCKTHKDYLASDTLLEIIQKLDKLRY